MEYLVLLGTDLRTSLSQALGNHANFFWSVAAPIGLGIVWLGSIYALWQTWSASPSNQEGGGGMVLKLFFSAFISLVLLVSGTGLEYLLLGGGSLHSRVLASLLNVVS